MKHIVGYGSDLSLLSLKRIFHPKKKKIAVILLFLRPSKMYCRWLSFFNRTLKMILDEPLDDS